MSNNRVNVEIGAQVAGFVDGMNKATESAKAYETENRKIADSLGNFKKEIGTARRDVLNLANAYRQLSDEEKQSQFGKEMATRLAEAKQHAADLIDLQGDLNTELRNMASDTQTFDILTDSMGVLLNTMSAGMGVVAQFTGNEKDAQKALVMFTTATSALSAATKIQNALQMQSNVMLGVTKIQTLAAAAAERIKTAATGQGIIATKAATVAQAAFNAVANANPYVLLATAIIAVGAALWTFCSNSDDATEKQKQLNTALENGKKASEAYQNTLASEYSKMMTGYTKLKAQWSGLANDTQRKKFINEHKSELESLGAEIKNVADAEGFFNKDTSSVVDGFLKRAKAAAYAAKATELYRQQMELIDKYHKLQETGFKKGDKAPDSMTSIVTADNSGGTYNNGRLTYNNGQWALTEKGASELNKNTQAYKDLNHAYLANEAELKKVEAQMTSLYAEIKEGNVITEKTTNSTNNQISTTKKQISTYKEAIAEYDKLEKEKAEIDNLIQSNRVGDEGKKGLLGEIDNIDAKMKALVEKWNIKAKVELVPPRESEIEAINKIVNTALSPDRIGTKQYDFSNLPDEFKKSADKTLEHMQRIEKAKEDLNKIIQDKNSSDAQIAAAQTGVENLSNAYSQLEQQANVYQTLANEADKLTKHNEKVVDSLNSIGGAVQAAGDMFSALGKLTNNTELNIAGLVAQAIATVALSYAQALASAKTWVDWLAFGLSGAATMFNLISQIKSATAGSYATGGIIPGSSYSGDRLTANVNSGEMILNKRQQANLFNAIDQNKLNGAGETIVIGETRIKGSDLAIIYKNYAKGQKLINKNVF